MFLHVQLPFARALFDASRDRFLSARNLLELVLCSVDRALGKHVDAPAALHLLRQLAAASRTVRLMHARDAESRNGAQQHVVAYASVFTDADVETWCEAACGARGVAGSGMVCGTPKSWPCAVPLL